MSKQSARRRKARMVKAASKASASIDLSGELGILAAANDADGKLKGPRRYEMLAYAGGPLNVSAYPIPIVIDLDGMECKSAQLPTYYGHHDGSDGSQLVGHSDKHDTTGGKLVVSGAMSVVNEHSAEVMASHDNGYKWQASVGVQPSRADLEELRSGQTATINGQQITGPVLIARKSVLKHIAILPEGADPHTELSIAAKAANLTRETGMNEFDKWVLAQFGGEEVPDMTDKQVATFQARYDAEKAAAPVVEGKAANTPVVPEVSVDAIVKTHAKHQATIEAKGAAAAPKINDAAKLGEIMAAATTKSAELKVEALDGDWPASRLEVALVKAESDTTVKLLEASLPTAQTIHGSTQDVNSEVIEAALCMSAGLEKPEDHFDEKTLEAASAKGIRNIGLQQVLISAATANGYICRPGERVHKGNLREVLEYACPPRMIHASGWSGLDVSGILSNTGNKILLSGFDQIPQSWRQVAAIQTVTDFKQVTRYRMTADLEYEEVPPGGEIQHGTLGEESYTIQAQTYAKMLALTRQDIINDDLGAFNDLRNRLGIGAAIKMNKLFWKMWLAARNAGTFWTGSRGNLVTSAPVSEAGYTKVVKAFRDLKAPDGNMMSLTPKFVIVPTDLEFASTKLYVSQEVRDTTATTKTMTTNIYQNKFLPIVIPEMGDSDFTGYSATDWHMIADPIILAQAAMCFLNGQQSPTIESADADFNTLGFQLRGYHDFGVAMSEYRAGTENQA